MTIQLNEDDYLSIQLLSYDKPSELTERFYFLETSTLQATSLMPQNKKIISSNIVAYNNENEYLDEQTIEMFKTVSDFNIYFINNPEYYIHDCDLKFENNIKLSSHDDGEVSIQFPCGSTDQTIINKIFSKYNLDRKLIDTLKNKSGHYIAIDKQNNITADYKDFDEYLRETGLKK